MKIRVSYDDPEEKENFLDALTNLQGFFKNVKVKEPKPKPGERKYIYILLEK